MALDWTAFGFLPRRSYSKAFHDPDRDKGFHFVYWTKTVRSAYDTISCKIIAVDHTNELVEEDKGRYRVEWIQDDVDPWNNNSVYSQIHVIPNEKEARRILPAILLRNKNIEEPDPQPEPNGFRNVEEYSKWLKDNDIEEIAASCVTWPTTNPKDWKGGEDSGEFCVKLDNIGKLHYIDPSLKKKFAQWLKLTDELF
jgi:hypothetical protein